MNSYLQESQFCRHDVSNARKVQQQFGRVDQRENRAIGYGEEENRTVVEQNATQVSDETQFSKYTYILYNNNISNYAKDHNVQVEDRKETLPTNLRIDLVQIYEFIFII